MWAGLWEVFFVFLLFFPELSLSIQITCMSYFPHVEIDSFITLGVELVTLLTTFLFENSFLNTDDFQPIVNVLMFSF